MASKVPGPRPAQSANFFESTLEQLTATLESFQGQLHFLQAEHEALCQCLDRDGILPAQRLEQELQQRQNGSGNADNGILKPTGPLSSVPEAEPTHPRSVPVQNALPPMASAQLPPSQPGTRQMVLQQLQRAAPSRPAPSPARSLPVASTGPAPAPAPVSTAPSPVSTAASPLPTAQSPPSTVQSPASPVTGGQPTAVSSRAKTPTRQPERANSDSAASPSSTPGTWSTPARQAFTRSPQSDGSSKGFSSSLGSQKMNRGIPMDQRDLHTLMLPLLLGYGSATEQEEALKAIQKLLKMSPDAHSVWAGVDSPIQAAVNADRADLVRVLLRSRADANSSDDKGVSMLHLSTYNNNPGVCHTLLMARADVNGCDCHGQTSLFFASSVEVCRLLVFQEADVTILNRMGQSALHLAALGGFGEVYEWLSSRVNRELFDLPDMTGASASNYAKDAGLLRADGAPKRVSQEIVRQPRPVLKKGKRVKLKRRGTHEALPFRMPDQDHLVRDERHGRGGRKIQSKSPSPAAKYAEEVKARAPAPPVPLEPWELVEASRRDDPDRWRAAYNSRGIENGMAPGRFSRAWQSDRMSRSQRPGDDASTPAPVTAREAMQGLGLPSTSEERREEDDLAEVIGALELLQSEGADFACVAREYLKKTAEDRGAKSVVPPEIAELVSASSAQIATATTNGNGGSSTSKADTAVVSQTESAQDRTQAQRPDAQVESVQRGGGSNRSVEPAVCSSLGPAWTRGEIEKPAGTRDMGGWTKSIYTSEQQERLAVDEEGLPRTDASAIKASADSVPQSTAEPVAPSQQSNLADSQKIAGEDAERTSAKKPEEVQAEAAIGDSLPTEPQSKAGEPAGKETEVSQAVAQTPAPTKGQGDLEDFGILEEVGTWSGALEGHLDGNKQELGVIIEDPAAQEDAGIFEDTTELSDTTKTVGAEPSTQQPPASTVATPSSKDAPPTKRNSASRRSGTPPAKTAADRGAAAFADAGIFMEEELDEEEEDDFEEEEEEDLDEDPEEELLDEEGFGEDVW